MFEFENQTICAEKGDNKQHNKTRYIDTWVNNIDFRFNRFFFAKRHK